VQAGAKFEVVAMDHLGRRGADVSVLQTRSQLRLALPVSHHVARVYLPILISLDIQDWHLCLR